MQHGRQNGTQARIDVQRGIVASRVPGRPPHALPPTVQLQLQAIQNDIARSFWHAPEPISAGPELPMEQERERAGRR